MFEAMRKEIERKLGILAIDIYGLSEVIGPGSHLSAFANAGFTYRRSFHTRDNRSSN